MVSVPRILAQFLLGIFLLAAPARATWSILIIDTATGEVAIGIATCLVGFDLRPSTIVVVPGVGVAAAQSFVGPLSLRQLIRTELLGGTPPSQILAMLATVDPGHQSRQYGIADVNGGTVTFTGTGAGAWAGGLTGQLGTLVYTVQGNVLTGAPVIQAAEQAILNTAGDVSQKLMAAMQAARAMGGDGRCSCSTGGPTACGSPPASFTKSAHIGLMIVSRPGDLDAPCGGASGCGGGQYFMDLNIANQPASAPDPVVQLQALFNTWWAQQAGRPDHFQSTVAVDRNRIRSNGFDTVTGTVVLRDRQGNPLGTTPTVSVELSPMSTVGHVDFGPVVRQANGSYTFTMTSALSTGEAILDVVADDGQGRVVVSPRPVIAVADPFGNCGVGAVSNGQGGVLDALRIDGSGGDGRMVTMGYGQPFTLTLDPPVGAPVGGQVGLFALWAHLGVPHPSAALHLGAGRGALCFTPAPLNPSAPTLLVADSFGLGGFIAATPAPWTFPMRVNALLDVALQGALISNLQGSVVATNAVMLRLVALPQPVITAVSPPAALAGTPVTVLGSEFFPGIELTVAGNPVPISSRTRTAVNFTMPGGVLCDSTLTVTNPGGTPVSVPINATPVITSTPVSSGSAAGGTYYSVIGQHLWGATVTIGGNPLTVVGLGANAIVGTTPPGTVGPATVVVRNAVGCQATTTFTYL